MRRTIVTILCLFGMVALPTDPALSLSCDTGSVVWIEAYNSGDGSYKHIYWQGGNRYFAGTGTDYINTHQASNAYVNIYSDSVTATASEYCVPEGVELR